MLQRKQTVFLALAAALSLATWLFPIAEYDRLGEHYVLHTTGFVTPEGTVDPDFSMKVPFSLLHTVLAGVLLVSIFLYRNRARQRAVVRITYMLVLGLIAFQFITENSVSAYLSQTGAVESSYGLSFFIPLVVLVLTFLAERGIRADEALVRSMDRLR